MSGQKNNRSSDLCKFRYESSNSIEHQIELLKWRLVKHKVTTQLCANTSYQHKMRLEATVVFSACYWNYTVTNCGKIKAQYSIICTLINCCCRSPEVNCKVTVSRLQLQKVIIFYPVLCCFTLFHWGSSAFFCRAVDPTTFTVPSYEEVVGTDDYPVRNSNLRQSTSQLPSYEDIIAAVENEGAEPANNPTEATPLNDQTPAPAQPTAEPQADPAGLRSNPSLPSRSASRASRLLRPLRVRRIKSDKLHLKDFRLQIRTPTQNPVTIEPITPPPQYDNKMPELQPGSDSVPDE